MPVDQPQHMSFANLRKTHVFRGFEDSPDHKGRWKPSDLHHAMKLIVT